MEEKRGTWGGEENLEADFEGGRKARGWVILWVLPSLRQVWEPELGVRQAECRPAPWSDSVGAEEKPEVQGGPMLSSLR